jgi:hypothetical protein
MRRGRSSAQCSASMPRPARRRARGRVRRGRVGGATPGKHRRGRHVRLLVSTPRRATRRWGRSRPRGRARSIGSRRPASGQILGDAALDESHFLGVFCPMLREQTLDEFHARARSAAPCLPSRVRGGQARGAWPVSGRDGGLLVGEEHAALDVPAARDGAEGGRAVEPAVPPARPMAPEGAWRRARVGPAVRAQQRVRLDAQAADSSASSRCLASTPPTYCPMVPSLRTTR